MTGRSRFTAEELERMDQYAEIAAKLPTDEIARLLLLHRSLGNRELVDALATALMGR